MNKGTELNDKLVSYAHKLNEGSGEGDAISKRAKKRILQKLGKLKKQIIQESTDSSNTESKRKYESNEDEGGDGEDNCNKVQKVSTESKLSKKELKVKLRILNQELAEFAQKKQLKLAKKKVLWADNKGYKLDVHTYTNLINVYVRCNDMIGAESVLTTDMKTKGIQPNLITYTTLMKGYCEAGQLDKSSEVFFQAMKGVNRTSGVTMRPNTRSLNTFLRGCSRVGAVKAAYKAYKYFIAFSASDSTSATNSKHTGDDDDDADEDDDETDGAADSTDYQPDASTFEYLVGILSRSGNLSAAVSVVSDFISSSSSSSSRGGSTKAAGGADVIENAAIYLALAKAYAAHGSLQHAKKWLLLAGSAVKVTHNVTLKENMLKRFQLSGTGDDSARSGGSSAAKSHSHKDAKEGGGTSKSVALFLNHRRAEIQNEAQLLEDYILNVESGLSTGTTATGRDQDTLHLNACLLYLRYLSQVLYFGFDGQCDYDATLVGGNPTHTLPGGATNPESAGEERERVAAERDMDSAAGRLVLALRDKFGLYRASPLTPGLYDDNYAPVSAAQQQSEQHQRVKRAVSSAKKDCMARLMAAVDAQSGHIQFDQLFPQFARPVANEEEDMQWGGEELEGRPRRSLPPIKLEICSGNGEWVVAQAAADRGAFVVEKQVTNSAGANSSGVSDVKALWVALELRCDRVHNTLCQHMFSSNDLARPVLSAGDTAPNRNNLAVIGGDASKILPSRFAPGGLSAIFVNHPQPPEQRSADKDKKKTEGSHLLTAAFFLEMHRVLARDGTVTIVTDNQPYAKLLADSLVEMAEKALWGEVNGHKGGRVAFVSKHLDSDATRSLQETLYISPAALVPTAASSSKKVAAGTPCIETWRGEPGVEGGHVAPSASSYFDRMWDLGQKKRRYFLFLKKME